jgi:hypothetical protein
MSSTCWHWLVTPSLSSDMDVTSHGVTLHVSYLYRASPIGRVDIVAVLLPGCWHTIKSDLRSSRRNSYLLAVANKHMLACHNILQSKVSGLSSFVKWKCRLLTQMPQYKVKTKFIRNIAVIIGYLIVQSSPQSLHPTPSTHNNRSALPPRLKSVCHLSR